MKGFLFLFSFLIITQVIRAVPVDVVLRPEEPDYKKLQTVVRIKQAESRPGRPRDACNCDGFELMIETRDRTHKERHAWYGTVTFNSNSGSLMRPYAQESIVKLDYYTHPNYYGNIRTYGGIEDVAVRRRTNRPFLIFHGGDGVYNDNQDGVGVRDVVLTSQKKKGLTLSLFEWELPTPKSINDLITAINGLRLSENRFPDYYYPGFSAAGEATNCVGFSLALLWALGAPVNNLPSIARYIGDPQSPFPRTIWGQATNFLKYATATTGLAFGGLVGGALVIEGAKNGALVGIWGGPVGIVAGGLFGATVGFKAGLLVGKGVKGVLDVPREIFSIKHPMKFIRFLYENREATVAKVVLVGRGDDGNRVVYRNDVLLKLINEIRGGWFQPSRIQGFSEDESVKYRLRH
jgi:hypothetical protein